VPVITLIFPWAGNLSVIAVCDSHPDILIQMLETKQESWVWLGWVEQLPRRHSN